MDFYKDIIITVILLLIILNADLFCQIANKVNDIKISDIPTSEELNSEFLLATKGKHDPYEVMSKVVSKKDNAIEALDNFLFSQSQLQKPGDTVKIDEPNKQYAIYSLMGIASPKAIQVLYKAAVTHPDKEVKALALRMFAWNMYYKAQNDQNEPDKKILHLLINNADDTTYCSSIRKRIGEISREGIKNWTGEDYGELPLEHEMVKLDDKTPAISIESYREDWWQKNNLKISWNRDTQHFLTNLEK